MNRVDLIGRLTKDPEIRYTDKNKAVCNFTIAVNRKEEADFISIEAFDKVAENCHKFLKKGNQVGVEGSIKTGSYEKDGQKYYTTKIWANTVHFLTPNTITPKEEKNAENSAQNESSDGLDDEVFRQFGESIEINDEDIAF